LRKKLRTLCRRYPGAKLEFSDNRIVTAYIAGLDEFRAAVLSVITETGARPYSGPEVLKRLSIRNSERLRWTKQQRLRVSGGNILTRGQRVSVVTYDVDQIDEIAKNPSIIDGWRHCDEAPGDPETK
jgi:hypothetical protein